MCERLKIEFCEILLKQRKYKNYYNYKIHN